MLNWKIDRAFIASALRQWQTYVLLISGGVLLWAQWALIRSGLVGTALSGLYFGLGLLGLAAAGYGLFYSRGRRWKFQAILLCVVMIIIASFVRNYTVTLAAGLYKISGPRVPYVQSIGVYTSRQAPVTSVQSLNGQILGRMEGRHDALVEKLVQELKDQGVEVKLKSYSSLQSLAKAARSQAVRAMVLTPSDARIAQELTGSSQQGALPVAFKTTVDTEATVPAHDEINVLEDPFTILVSASEFPLADVSYPSTLNVLITVNPKTRQTLYTVIPRNLFTEQSCEKKLGCLPEGTFDKVEYASFQSLEALRQTLEKLLENPIDFTARIDLRSLGQLVELQPNMGIDTTRKFTNDEPVGAITTMTPARVRQYLGVLSNFAASDFDQELNQLRMLVSFGHQADRLTKMSILKQALAIIDQSVSTSMSYSQLSELVRYHLLDPSRQTILYDSIGGRYLPAASATLTEHAYVIEPDAQSLQAVRSRIADMLSGKVIETQGVAAPAAPENASAGEALKPQETTPYIDPNEALRQSQGKKQAQEQAEQQVQPTQPAWTPQPTWTPPAVETSEEDPQTGLDPAQEDLPVEEEE